MSEQEDNVVDLGTRRPIPRPQGGFAALQPHLTFRNIVIALGLATFLIFIGSVVSARIAFLSVPLSILA